MTGNILDSFLKNTLKVYKTVYAPRKSSGQLRPRYPLVWDEEIFQAAYRSYCGKSLKLKKILFAFIFLIIIIFFLLFWNFFSGIDSLSYNHKWLRVSWLYDFLTQILIFTNFGRTNMKTSFDESCSRIGFFKCRTFLDSFC